MVWCLQSIRSSLVKDQLERSYRRSFFLKPLAPESNQEFPGFNRALYRLSEPAQLLGFPLKPSVPITAVGVEPTTSCM